MAKKNIIPKTVAGETATQSDIRIVMMPLYPTTTPIVKVFNGYYKSNGKRIEHVDGEGNYTIGDAVSAESKTDLYSALVASVGAVTEALLSFHQLYDTAYYLSYKQGGEYYTKKLIGSYFTTEEEDLISDLVLTASGSTELPADEEDTSGLWLNRKSITVSCTTAQTNYPVTVTIYNTSGTDSGTDVYLNGKVNSDWSDIRILTGSTPLPYAIVKQESTYIRITFLAPALAIGSTYFFLLYNRASIATPYKIACLTDTHYDAITDDTVNRTHSLEYIDNFVSRMSTYLPDLAVNNGDKTGAGTSNETTQLSWYQSNITHFAAVSAHATVVKDGVAPGNHDFEYIHFANTLAKHSSETWMESGKMYGYWESDDFRFISLDSNYTPNTQTHKDYSHQGYGYINTDQLDWLTSILSASLKPCVIFCHHALGEFDTAEYTLTKETYHVQNRTAVRDILEASGKVICVLHGHVHWFRADSINGIPYLCMEDISIGGEFHELPVNTEGKWTLIEINQESKSIRYKQEYRVSGVDTVAYDYIIPYQTSFDVDVANFPEKVFANGYLATYEKASVALDPSQLYINNRSYIWTEPSNLCLSEPQLSGRTFKLQGLTDAPNYGRAVWDFAPQTGKFRVRLSARLATVKEKIIKVMNSNTSAYLYFSNGGNIIALNGLTENTLQAYSANTWYDIDIKIDTAASTYSVYIDGVLKASNYSFYQANTTLNKVELVTQSGNMFIDFLRIEKYITTEPTVTAWGTEENVTI